MKKEIETITEAIRYIKKAFGKEGCPEFNPDCAACQGHLLIGYLEWYLNLLKYNLYLYHILIKIDSVARPRYSVHSLQYIW